MRRIRMLAALGLAMAGASACSSFLNTDRAVNDPNAPSAASLNQLFTGVQANIFGEQEGGTAMLICEWVQQCSGVNDRFVEQQATYSVTAGSFSTDFGNIYSGGGLIGIKTVESMATAAGDKKYLGIAQVLEAMNMLYAADNWGDVPYSEAAGDNPTPKFDPQMEIYGKLLTLLDQAIANIQAGGNGPGLNDLVYGDLSPSEESTAWIEAAHTLKARIHLHQEEKLGSGEYQAAITEAKLGISTPKHDWKTLHSGATSERNLWAQFQTSSFGADLVAGSVLADIMNAQNDPRRPDYFGKNSNGGYGGFDITTKATDPATISPIAGSNRTNDVTFRQPIITWEENQLILAEANFMTSGAAAAAPYLNAVRAVYSKPAIATPTLTDIMQEKYISLFQNIEAWNDYKRTCLPVLMPPAGKQRVPGRLIYGQTEEQTNPNTPSSDQQSLMTVRNANDPNACQ